MKTLKEIKTRLVTVEGQIANEQLTSDHYINYHIRRVTSDLCVERNMLKSLAFDEYGELL
jgi:hypothetical protein